MAGEVSGVRQAAVQFARANGVPEALLGDLRLAISEAVTNAVVHAFRNQEQPGTVAVSVDVRSPELAEVIVRDDGMGMSRRSDSPGLGLGLGLIARGLIRSSIARHATAPGSSCGCASGSTSPERPGRP